MRKGTLRRGEEKKSEWEETQKMNEMKLSLQQRKMISPGSPGIATRLFIIISMSYDSLKTMVPIVTGGDYQQAAIRDEEVYSRRCSIQAEADAQ